MKKFLVFMFSLSIVIGVVSIAREEAAATIDDASIQAKMEELKRMYATEVIMGAPMEVDDLKIIPLAIAGFGFGQHAMHREGEKGEGETGTAGGVMIPVGVLVISGKKVQLLQISKGFIEQIGGALAPIMVQLLSREQVKAEEKDVQVKEKKPTKVSVPDFSGFLKSIRFVIIGLFLLGWLALIFLIDLFLPQQVTAIASTLQGSFWRTVLTGVVSFIVVVLLTVALTVSLIGIPLTLAVLILTCALTLFGSVGLTLLVGQKVATAFRDTHYSDVISVLIGGIIVGILGILPIPFFAWFVWIVVSVPAFGAVLLLQWERAKKLKIEN